MKFYKINRLLKPSPAGEGGVRRSLNNSLLQDSLA